MSILNARELPGCEEYEDLVIADESPYSVVVNRITKLIRTLLFGFGLRSTTDFDCKYGDRLTELGEIADNAAKAGDEEANLVATKALDQYVKKSEHIIELESIWYHLCRAVCLLEKPSGSLVKEFDAEYPLWELMGVADASCRDAAAVLLIDVQYYLSHWVLKRTLTALNSIPSISEKGSIAAAAQWEPAREVVEGRAEEIWNREADDPPKISDVVDFLYRDMRDNPDVYGAPRTLAKSTVRNYVRNVAPEELSKPGRRPKRN